MIGTESTTESGTGQRHTEHNEQAPMNGPSSDAVAPTTTIAALEALDVRKALPLGQRRAGPLGVMEQAATGEWCLASARTTPPGRDQVLDWHQLPYRANQERGRSWARYLPTRG